jgi:hypothetical protein
VPESAFLHHGRALQKVLLGSGGSWPRGAGCGRSVAHDDGIVARDEVGRASFRQGVELPVPGHPRGLLAVVSLAQGLPVADRGPAAAAMRVDVICFEAGGGATAAEDREVMLAPVAGQALRDPT